jgi:hypothetical protein
MKTEVTDAFSQTKIEFLGLEGDAETTASNVADAFINEDWAGAGLSIGQGVAAGITASTPAITAAAEAAALAALEAMKRKLGINSPSSVARDEVGAMIPPGIAEGITASPILPSVMTTSTPAAAAQRTPDEAADLLAAALSGGGNNSTLVKVYIGAEELDARIVRVVEEKI